MKMIIAFITYMACLIACAAGVFLLASPWNWVCGAIFVVLGLCGVFIFEGLRKLSI